MRLSTYATLAALLLAAPVPAFAQETTTEQATTQTSAAASVDTFAQAAAQNSLSEVLLSAMALQKSNDKRVDDYAWTMLDHHARAMGDLADALSPGAAALPAEPSAEQKARLERMRGLEGQAFDDAYFAHQLEAHGKAIAVFEEGEKVSDETVAQYARTTLPILQAHLEIARIRQSMPPEPMPAE